MYQEELRYAIKSRITQERNKKKDFAVEQRVLELLEQKNHLGGQIVLPDDDEELAVCVKAIRGRIAKLERNLQQSKGKYGKATETSRFKNKARILKLAELEYYCYKKRYENPEEYAT